MDRRSRILILTITAIAVASTSVFADVILDANFEGMTIDQPVGMGGAAVGEPIDFSNCQTMIRDAPFASNCLEISDNADFGTGTVRFGFLDDAEVTTGVVEISVKLWFSEPEGAVFYVREQSSSADTYATLHFAHDGDIGFNDEAGNLGVVGTYQGGQAYDLAFRYDMDAGTYDMWWDGSLVIEGRAHGIVGSGVGGVIIGVDHDVDLDGIVWVDDLTVETIPNVDADSASWSAVKTLWR